MTDQELAMAIAKKIEPSGGKVYLVGGIVRDEVLGKENKDIDIEVHFPEPEGYESASEEKRLEMRQKTVKTFEETLKSFLHGKERLSLVGESFGVYRLGHYDVDIALPRTEKAIGRGHRDFEVSVDPFLDPMKAAERRDFTMNAMMKDVTTGEILDFFHGQEDIKNGIIRHVNDQTFQEDPLRVLRAAQFAARFNFSVAEETRELSKAMDISTVVRERIMGEMEKALLKADKPSIFFEEMRKMDHLDHWFPEMKAMIGVPQSPEHHPEGDVWTHTMMVIDEAAKLRDQAQYPLGFMTAAAVHDLGKPATTETDLSGRIHAINHEYVGVDIAEQFLRRITNHKDLLNYAYDLTENHMKPNQLAENNAGLKATRKMFDNTSSPEDLLLLSKADHFGRGKVVDYEKTEEFLKKRLDDYKEIMSRPEVTGKDLIEEGFEPGKFFKQVLEETHKMHLAGVDKEEALKQARGVMKTLEKKAEKETSRNAPSR